MEAETTNISQHSDTIAAPRKQNRKSKPRRKASRHYPRNTDSDSADQGCFGILKKLSCSLQCGGTSCSIKETEPIDSESSVTLSSDTVSSSSSSLDDSQSVPPSSSSSSPTKKLAAKKRKLKTSQAAPSDLVQDPSLDGAMQPPPIKKVNRRRSPKKPQNVSETC